MTGKYRGSKLYTVPGQGTRPTSDFNREVIFSKYPDYKDLRVLDLFAGTGSFGLECLSRGAEWVDFVEFANQAIAVLLLNIAKLNCSDQCHIHRRRVEQYLAKADHLYDVIFLDPPYDKGLVEKCLDLIFAGDMLKPEGIVIVEHSAKERIPDRWLPRLIDTRAGKITSFSIFGSAETGPDQ
ncbi:MAG TPA: 16S rRNA (guanine(966)-N(2))-methyltransferase RsmD [Candidatus Cloacimonadota bacterium]|nr:16S rRNA (guanine(966)-N(2))-methyltransferase RsmD [Candidatus Cloacimonadota bacterium]